MENLKMEREVHLTENNINVEYLDINYECNVCEDTGYLSNGERCNCLKQALINKAYKMSNIEDRKSTRLNSSHVSISYAVFCLKKKTKLFKSQNASQN